MAPKKAKKPDEAKEPQRIAPDAVQQIAAALRKYAPPGPPADGAGIPTDALVPGMARHLLMTSPRSARPPSKRGLSEKGSRKELAVIRSRAARLREALEAAHAPTVAALNFQEVYLRRLASELRHLEVTAKKGEPPDLPQEKGRPHNHVALEVTRAAAAFYLMLTGQKPDRGGNRNGSGEFLGLVHDVFEALGIDANAEHFVKEVLALPEESLRNYPFNLRD